VGFLEPPNLEKNIIYVDVSKIINSSSFDILAYSNKKFNYLLNSLKEQENAISTSEILDYHEFIEMLKNENNSDAKYDRMKSDGLILTGKIMSLRKQATELRVKLSNLLGKEGLEKILTNTFEMEQTASFLMDKKSK